MRFKKRGKNANGSKGKHIKHERVHYSSHESMDIGRGKNVMMKQCIPDVKEMLERTYRMGNGAPADGSIDEAFWQMVGNV
jgi:hypothetical protein